MRVLRVIIWFGLFCVIRSKRESDVLIVLECVVVCGVFKIKFGIEIYFNLCKYDFVMLFCKSKILMSSTFVFEYIVIMVSSVFKVIVFVLFEFFLVLCEIKLMSVVVLCWMIVVLFFLILMFIICENVTFVSATVWFCFVIGLTSLVLGL